MDSNYKKVFHLKWKTIQDTKIGEVQVKIVAKDFQCKMQFSMYLLGEQLNC